MFDVRNYVYKSAVSNVAIPQALHLSEPNVVTGAVEARAGMWQVMFGDVVKRVRVA